MWRPDKGGDFQKLAYGSETLHMTSEGCRGMFEGEFADMRADNIAHVNGGTRDPVQCGQTGREDPHRRERKLVRAELTIFLRKKIASIQWRIILFHLCYANISQVLY